MAYRCHYPIDPDCPFVCAWRQTFWDDPMTAACGCADEIAEDWERRHVRRCERCRAFGYANVEIVD
jgi:hypothetical protein